MTYVLGDGAGTAAIKLLADGEALVSIKALDVGLSCGKKNLLSIPTK